MKIFCSIAHYFLGSNKIIFKFVSSKILDSIGLCDITNGARIIIQF